MSKAESKEAPLRALVRQLGLDAIVAMSPENFAYVSGVHILTVALIRPRQAFAIIPATGEPELVLCSIEKALSVAEGWIPTVHGYTEFVEEPMDMLADRLAALGVSEGRVGIDKDFLPISSHEKLVRKLPKLQLIDTTEHIAALRAIKTPREISMIEHATRGTHRAVLDAMQQSRQGDTERDMCMRIANGILGNGADGTLFLCFSSGARTMMSHAMATDLVPAESDIIRFDVGGVYGSYASDFARTYSTGNPTTLQRQTYSALLRVQKATIAAIQPGITAEDLFFVCRDAFKTEGLTFTMPHIGHSFGIELHETPLIRPGEKIRIAAGMALNIEPITTDETGRKYHTEDLVEVTATGTRLMTLGYAPEEIPVLGQTIAANA
jgi:Xaa-Pro aminopeptidase